MVLRIYRLCSLHCHIKGLLKDFYGHLLDRGDPHATIKPLFVKAVRRAGEYISSSEEYILQRKALSQKANNKLFLHFKYTPGDPDSKTIQKLWRELVLHTPTEQASSYFLQKSHGREACGFKISHCLQQTTQYWKSPFLQKDMQQTRAESVILPVIRHY